MDRPFSLRNSKEQAGWSPQARPDEVILDTYPPNDWVADLLEEVGVQEQSTNAAEQLQEACGVWPSLSPYGLYNVVELYAWGIPSQKVSFHSDSL